MPKILLARFDRVAAPVRSRHVHRLACCPPMHATSSFYLCRRVCRVGVYIIRLLLHNAMVITHIIWFPVTFCVPKYITLERDKRRAYNFRINLSHQHTDAPYKAISFKFFPPHLTAHPLFAFSSTFFLRRFVHRTYNPSQYKVNLFN